MGNNFIDVINENMSKMNPELHKKLKKKLNKRDIAIFYLLSHEKSILFISDSTSRTRLFNLFASYEIEYLVCDFEEDIMDESFLEYVIEDSNMSNDFNVDELFQKKRSLELKITTLSAPYSNLKLYPYILKEKREYYLSKLNNNEIICPIGNIDTYDLESVKIITDNIKNIIDNYGDVFKYADRLPSDFLKSEEFKNIVLISNSFKENLDEFISLNNKLNKLLGLTKFDNLNSVELLRNLSVLSNNCLYVDEEDRYGINEILKIYFKTPSIDLSSFSKINKYALENTGLLESIENNIKFSELVDNNIQIDDKKRRNLILLTDKINILVDISKYIKKQLFEFSKYIEKFPYFETDMSSFNMNNNFDELNTFFDNFCIELDKLKKYNEFLEYNYLNDDEKFFIELVSSKKVDKNIICDVFQFNIYNSLLNNFLKEFDYIDESKLRTEDYQHEINLINNKLGDLGEDQHFINIIKYSSAKLNNDDLIVKQKEDLDKKINNGNIDSNWEVLEEYRELIMANRRVFLINEVSLEKLTKINYAQYFDYIIKGDEIISNKG